MQSCLAVTVATGWTTPKILHLCRCIYLALMPFCSEQSNRSNRKCGKNIEKGLAAAFLSLLCLAPERPVVPLHSLVVCTSIRSVRIGQLVLLRATLLDFGLIVLQREVRNAFLLSLTHFFGFSLLFVSQSLGVSPVCVYTDFADHHPPHNQTFSVLYGKLLLIYCAVKSCSCESIWRINLVNGLMMKLFCFERTES